jgi:hypothetical protein
MAQKADSHSYVPATATSPAKLVLHDGLTNYTFAPYTGQAPVQPSDLAAMEGRLTSATSAVQAAIMGAIAAMQAAILAAMRTGSAILTRK